ncbi:MAG TPA: thiamine pyrophosphate-dependent enzyme [Stellaceae bacterium]|nr:thiamine pyrophosphate-dependent enzyme [Stellaceae bacterium]
MPQTASDILIDTLIDWGVDTVFGIPGDGVNGIIEALRLKRDKIRFIQVRHEEAAAFAACGYAKFTGKLGCCIATSGPGGIHLLNGLYDAKLDGVPVLAITGLQFHDLLTTYTQQDVELDKLFMDVAKYNVRVMGPAHVENAVELACRTALAYRGVAHVTIPVDFQSQPVKKAARSARNLPRHVSEIWADSAHVPTDEALRRAAELLNAGTKITILAGRGALGARKELEEVAEILGAPIAKPVLGKACVPDESPYTTGGVGLLGTRPSQDALEGCDTLLIVGSSFPYIEFYPKPGQARAVQIELDPQRIGLRHPVEIGLVGDSIRVLRRLIPLLDRNAERGWLEAAQRGKAEWQKLMEERGTRLDMPMKPQVVAHELGRLLKDDAIIATDSGTITTWVARHVPIRGEQMFSLSGNLATMACGLPYAIGAQAAYPDRQVVAFVGDGGFTMLMGEIATAVKHELPIKVIIIKNNSLGQIKWEQMVFLGNPEYVCDLHPIDFAAFARACGAKGMSIERPEECRRVLEQAMATPGPVVVEALVDPNEPPMPPRVKPEQALHFGQALARGTPQRGKIALTVMSDTVREIV